MISKIKKKIETNLIKFVKDIDRLYSLKQLSPLLGKNIYNFVLRKGKRIRPIIFVIGYLGFTKKEPRNLFRSAVSTELLHDFMLIHDDIIDKSDTRRGKPSMHKMLDKHLANFKNLKFNGKDLGIVVGDVIYPMAIRAFLSIKESFERKERALQKFIEAAIYTGAGEFIELLNGVKGIERITKHDIYNIYDYKTARYTFCAPLASGAILAGASKNQVRKLEKFGIYLGRAFQIKDDILGMFSDEKKIGKSSLTDLNEAKRTILIWYAYNHSDNNYKRIIKIKLSKKKINKGDLLKVQEILINSMALNFAKREILRLKNEAVGIVKTFKMDKKYKDCLINYSNQLLRL